MAFQHTGKSSHTSAITRAVYMHVALKRTKYAYLIADLRMESALMTEAAMFPVVS